MVHNNKIVTVDIGPMPYRLAMELVRICIKNNIDTERAISILKATTTVPVPNIDWKLTVPEKYLTFLMLKYNEATF